MRFPPGLHSNSANPVECYCSKRGYSRLAPVSQSRRGAARRTGASLGILLRNSYATRGQPQLVRTFENIMITRMCNIQRVI